MADVRPTSPPCSKKPPSSTNKPSKPQRPVPKSPPAVIRGQLHGQEFQRLGFLGEGGFARVYEVQDAHGKRSAAKVVAQKALQTVKTRTKLYAEIKLHKMLDHPNIVGYRDCFQDEENVYINLELCEKGSLMDMIRRRKGLTEPEARYYMVQLIGACMYMHGENVIHRDLKLGNIFLDDKMELKVGDFGLAALIEKEGERKKTICGTPNYIAPEVLFDTANGHSFEVDVWSIGVILYTLIIGKPPFQTKEIKAIYKRIKDNQYDFPPEKPISSEAQSLISEILTTDPRKRPALATILTHPFFTAGPFPAALPPSATEYAPTWDHLSPQQSSANLVRVRAKATQARPISTSRVRASLGPSVAQQEREFHRAVQPGSPLSSLLSSARQPLLVSHETNLNREPSLLRKLSAQSTHRYAAAEASKQQQQRDKALPNLPPLSSRNDNNGLPSLGEAPDEMNNADAIDTEEADSMMEDERQRELAEQKARIVTDMAPSSIGGGGGTVASSSRPSSSAASSRPGSSTSVYEPVGGTRIVSGGGSSSSKGKEAAYMGRALSEHERRGKENVALADTAPLRPSSSTGSSRLRSTQNAPPSSSSHFHPTMNPAPPPPPSSNAPPMGLWDVFLHNVTDAMDCKEQGRSLSHLCLPSPPSSPPVFIVSWLDYCNKYGMGYALTDGSVGVHFNDSTSLVIAPDKEHFDYISSPTPSSKSSSSTTTSSRSSRSATVVRKSYTPETIPDDLQSKLYLIRHFSTYMQERLYDEKPYCFVDTARTRGMDFVSRYLRMKNVIVFRLSCDVLQFNFYDHAKMVLSGKGLVVTFIDKTSALTTWSLEELLNLVPRDSAEKKLVESAKRKLGYVKILLGNIQKSSSSATSASSASVPPSSSDSRAPARTVSPLR